MPLRWPMRDAARSPVSDYVSKFHHSAACFRVFTTPKTLGSSAHSSTNSCQLTAAKRISYCTKDNFHRTSYGSIQPVYALTRRRRCPSNRPSCSCFEQWFFRGSFSVFPLLRPMVLESWAIPRVVGGMLVAHPMPGDQDSFRHLLAERAHDRLWVVVNNGQQNRGGAVWHPAPMFPILQRTCIEAKPVRELLATQLHTFPQRQNVFCSGIVHNAARRNGVGRCSGMCCYTLAAPSRRSPYRQRIQRTESRLCILFRI